MSHTRKGAAYNFRVDGAYTMPCQFHDCLLNSGPAMAWKDMP